MVLGAFRVPSYVIGFLGCFWVFFGTFRVFCVNFGFSCVIEGTEVYFGCYVVLL